MCIREVRGALPTIPRARVAVIGSIRRAWVRGVTRALVVLRPDAVPTEGMIASICSASQAQLRAIVFVESSYEDTPTEGAQRECGSAPEGPPAAP